MPSCPRTERPPCCSNRPDIRPELGLRRVINVSGTMTSLGASIVVPEAVETVSRILTEFVEIGDLHRKASAVIAAACGAEAGTVTASASAGITVSVAGCLTGADLARIERLPDTTRAGARRGRHPDRPHGLLRRAGRAGDPARGRQGRAGRHRHLCPALPPRGRDRAAHGGRGLRRLAPCGRLRPDRARRVLPRLPRPRRAGDRRRGVRVRPQGLPRRRRRPRHLQRPQVPGRPHRRDRRRPQGSRAGGLPAERWHRPRHEGRQGEHRRRHGGAGGLGAARPRRRPRLRARSPRALAGVPGPPAGARGQRSYPTPPTTRSIGWRSGSTPTTPAPPPGPWRRHWPPATRR